MTATAEFSCVSDRATASVPAEPPEVFPLVPTESAAAQQVQPFPQSNAYATIIHVQRHKLVRSKMNVRKKGANVQELAALIRSQGLLQNLIGFAQRTDGMETGIVEVVAGGRRMDAIDLLIDGGDLPGDYDIPVLLVTEEEAIDISLAENSGREAMHPADVFDAMLAMSLRGREPADIGFAFGLDAMTVKRRLKLAKVSPRLLNLYRDDKAGFEQMAALALVDDHEKQEQAWDGLPEYNRSAAALRRTLTQQQVSAESDPVARYVGLKAYEKAGGVVLRDLFSEKNAGYLQDPAMLDRMASAKLAKEVAKIEKEGGHAWVEARVRISHDELNEYGKVQTIRTEPFFELQTELDQIEVRLDEIERQREAAPESEDETIAGALDEQESRLCDRRRDIERKLVKPDPNAASLAGAVVTLTYDGKLVVHRNLIRPQDKQALKAAAKSTGGAVPARAAHSERLLRLLTSHRTSALAAEMMNHPKIAFAVLTQELVSSALNLYSPGLAKIHTQRPSLSDEARASAAYAAVEAKREVMGELLKTREEGQSLLVWLLGQPMETLMELMAFSVACTLDAVQGDEARSQPFDETARALNLDMGKWWSATSDNYFNHVSKARAVQVVTLAVSPLAAVPLEKMKKGEAANVAERAVATVRWLPDVLCTQAVAAVESEAGKLAPEGHAAGLAEQG